VINLGNKQHGGFYDHVPPPACEDDFPQLRWLGPRVPAFVISPWVGAGSVSSTVFDHTSIIKTILARFCRKPDGTVPDMGARARAAQHPGGVLTEPSPRAPIPRSAYQDLITLAQGWSDKLAAHTAIRTRTTLAAEATVTDFQQEFLALRQAVLAKRTPTIPAPPNS
jgi:Phosphoesterase family